MFVQLTFLWLHLHSFASPYFDHDVFMHHALHLLSASVPRGNRIPLKRETAALSACKASYSFVVTISATPPWIIMRQSFIGKKRVGHWIVWNSGTTWRWNISRILRFVSFLFEYSKKWTVSFITLEGTFRQCNKDMKRTQVEEVVLVVCHSFIQAISIAPLQAHYYSEALPTQHGHCVGV